jgi:hypothetical protein
LLTSEAGVVPALLALAVAMTTPIAFHRDALMMQSGLGPDAYIFLWNFWWTKRALVDLHVDPYLTPLLYTPLGANLALHTHPLPYALLSIPVQLAVPGISGIILANNLSIVLSFFLAGLGMYLLARQVTGSPMAAVLGAVFYAYSNYRFANTVRLHTLATEWFPFLMLFALRWSQTGRPRHAAATALALLAIFYSSLEYFAFTLVLVPLQVVSLLVFGQRQRVANLLAPRALATFAGLVLVLSAPLLFDLLPLLREQHVFAESSTFVADVGDLLLPNQRHPLWGAQAAALSATWHRGDAGLGLSLGYIGLLWMFALARRARPSAAQAKLELPVWFWLGWMAITLTFALGPRLHVFGAEQSWPMPYDWLSRALPFFNSSRCPMRWIALVQLFMGVVIAISAADLLAQPGRWRQGVVAISLALMLAESANGTLPMTGVEVSPSFAEIARYPQSGPLLQFPEPHARVMLLDQVVHGKPIAWYVTSAIPHANEASREALSHWELERFWGDVQQPDAVVAGRCGEPLWSDLQAAVARFHPSFLVVRRGELSTLTAYALEACFRRLSPADVRRFDDATVYIYDARPVTPVPL